MRATKTVWMFTRVFQDGVTGPHPHIENVYRWAVEKRREYVSRFVQCGPITRVVLPLPRKPAAKRGK